LGRKSRRRAGGKPDEPRPRGFHRIRLTSGALAEVLPEYRSIELGVYALYPSRKHLTPKVRALIDFLVEAFRMRAWPG
jgi:DNA-binding transcriptional LysR family regulator